MDIRRPALLATALGALWCSPAPAQTLQTHSELTVVGERSVTPLIQAVATTLEPRRPSGMPALDTLSDTGAALRFCSGIGAGTPDLAILPRALTPEEQKNCREHGTRPLELKVGYQVAVLAGAPGEIDWALTRRQVFLAVVRDAPTGPDEVLRPNAYRSWSDIDDGLPDQPIQISGAPANSPLADVFFDLVLEAGAKTFARLSALSTSDPGSFAKILGTLRSDGVFRPDASKEPVDPSDPGAAARLVVLDYSRLLASRADWRAAKLDGVSPTVETIRSEEYPAARAVYVYLKPEHAPFSPGLIAFAEALTSEDVIGDGGLAQAMGLVPADAQSREDARQLVQNLSPRPN